MKILEKNVGLCDEVAPRKGRRLPIRERSKMFILFHQEGSLRPELI